MAEIPVEKKALPVWVWPLLVIGLLGVGALLFCMLWKKPAQVTERVQVVPTSCNADSDCADTQLCLAKACIEIKTGNEDCATTRVHFDTDSAKIRSEDHATLDRTARCLRASAASKLTIEGNADERGSEDHNADLAEQRAMSVARYLQEHGVSGEQLRVISYGDNKPMCLDSDKECWAKNRRAALKPQ